MSAAAAQVPGAATQSMSTADFLTFVENENARTDGARWEFDGFEPQAMTGAPIGHHMVVQTLASLIRSQTPGGCRTFAESVFLRLPAAQEGDEPIRAPDLMVTFKQFDDTDVEVDSAILVVEVVSKSSVRRDRVATLAEYSRLTDIECYLIVDWQARSVELLRRDQTVLRHTDAGDTLDLGHGITVDTQSIFEDLE